MGPGREPEAPALLPGPCCSRRAPTEATDGGRRKCRWPCRVAAVEQLHLKSMRPSTPRGVGIRRQAQLAGRSPRDLLAAGRVLPCGRRGQPRSASGRGPRRSPGQPRPSGGAWESGQGRGQGWGRPNQPSTLLLLSNAKLVQANQIFSSFSHWKLVFLRAWQDLLFGSHFERRLLPLGVLPNAWRAQ